jgi:hypothetical protein
MVKVTADKNVGLRDWLATHDLPLPPLLRFARCVTRASRELMTVGDSNIDARHPKNKGEVSGENSRHIAVPFRISGTHLSNILDDFEVSVVIPVRVRLTVLTVLAVVAGDSSENDPRHQRNRNLNGAHEETPNHTFLLTIVKVRLKCLHRIMVTRATFHKVAHAEKINGLWRATSTGHVTHFVGNGVDASGDALNRRYRTATLPLADLKVRDRDNQRNATRDRSDLFA